MINSFYFITLISDRPINLDRGLLFAVNWSNQLSRMKPFHTRFFWPSNKQSCQSPENDFGGLVKLKRQRNQEQAWFQVGHISWTRLYSVTKIIALQLVTLLVFLSHVLSKTKWGCLLWIKAIS